MSDDNFNFIGGVDASFSEGANISLERAHGIDLAEEHRLTIQECRELRRREAIATGKRIEELIDEFIVKLWDGCGREEGRKDA